MSDVNTVSYRLRFADKVNPFSDIESSCTWTMVATENCSLYRIEINEEKFFGLVVKLSSPLSLLTPYRAGRYIVQNFINHELILFRSEADCRAEETSLRRKQTFFPFVENCQYPVNNGTLDYRLTKDDFFETVEDMGSNRVEIFNKVLELPLHHLDDLASSRKSSVSNDTVNSLREITIDIQDGERIETSFQKSGLGDLYRDLYRSLFPEHV
jgi:hypothetical protein